MGYTTSILAPTCSGSIMSWLNLSTAGNSKLRTMPPRRFHSSAMWTEDPLLIARSRSTLTSTASCARGPPRAAGNGAALLRDAGPVHRVQFREVPRHLVGEATVRDARDQHVPAAALKPFAERLELAWAVREPMEQHQHVGSAMAVIQPQRSAHGIERGRSARL